MDQTFRPLLDALKQIGVDPRAVDAVARRSGLGSASALRQHLHAAIGVAPSAYRRTFRLSTTQSSD